MFGRFGAILCLALLSTWLVGFADRQRMIRATRFVLVDADGLPVAELGIRPVAVAPSGAVEQRVGLFVYGGDTLQMFAFDASAPRPVSRDLVDVGDAYAFPAGFWMPLRASTAVAVERRR